MVGVLVRSSVRRRGGGCAVPTQEDRYRQQPVPTHTRSRRRTQTALVSGCVRDKNVGPGEAGSEWSATASGTV